jgi:hypothetical protein
MLKNKNPKIKKEDSCKNKICVVEKPKKIKKDPIDKIIVDVNRNIKNPPPMFSSLLSRLK